MLHNTGITDELKITFSYAKNPDNDPAISTFETNDIPISQLESLLKSYTYSTIIWNGTRKEASFRHAEACMLDFDNKPGQPYLSIEKVTALLRKKGLSFALITSKSYTPERHKFHVIIPFSRRVISVEEYRKIMNHLIDKEFRGADPAARDGARYFFQSPENASYQQDFSLNPLDVDAIPESSGTKRKGINLKKIAEELPGKWPAGYQVRTSDGNVISADSVDTKTQIYCPFHKDNTPSAFVDYSEKSKNHYIHCSTCDKTFWKEVDEKGLTDRYADYWAHGGSIYKSSFTGMDFSFQKIGTDMFYAQNDLKEQQAKEQAYSFLSKEKYLHSLGQIHSLGDIEAESPYYKVDQDAGITNVHIPGIPQDKNDPDFIMNWLEKTFGQYKQFILEYLAVYVYTNYTKLPTIVLLGDRGTGKNTFADFTGDFFSSLTVPVRSLSDNFNDYATKKLMVIDEVADDENRISYTQLKKLSGQTQFEVNKKYQATYTAPNNLNILLLSNNKTPFRLKDSEHPSDEYNNQFFVYEMPPLSGTPDPEFKKKLKERTGCFIRNELKQVFEKLMLKGRYSIKTPITDELTKLFDSSKGELDLVFDELISDIRDILNGEGVGTDSPCYGYKDWISAGYIRSHMLDELASQKHIAKSALVRRCNEEEVFDSSGSDKRRLNGKRETGYRFSAKFIAEHKKNTGTSDGKTEISDPNQTRIDMK